MNSILPQKLTCLLRDNLNKNQSHFLRKTEKKKKKEHDLFLGTPNIGTIELKENLKSTYKTTN
jgi:hypothetical protein